MLAEPPQRRDQAAPGRGADHADHHVAAFAAPHLLHLMQRAVGLIQQPLDVAQQRAAGRRQRHGAGGAFEQHHAELALQLLDVLAERRL